MPAPSLLLGLLSIASWPLVQGALFTDPKLLPRSTYDFIVVGGGTAGNVIANRLTEDPSFSVLVVEAGPSQTADPTDAIPFLAFSLTPNTLIDWNYTTTPQPNLDGRTILYPRGRVLGGTSTVNLMVWNRASVDDWNRYAEATGDAGWSWDAMLPYMMKSENLEPSADNIDLDGKVNPLVHGTNGPLEISLEGYPLGEIDSRILAMTEGHDPAFPFNLDMNDGYPLGLGWATCAINETGRRSDSATGYLDPVMSRPNLDVLINAQVTKLLPSNDSWHDIPSFTTVEIAQGASAQVFTMHAKKEVILSAGAVNTPQILQLSGIGDPELLKSVGVTPIVNSPGVGQNLIDHPLIATNWFVNSNDTFDTIARNDLEEAALLEEWTNNGTGLFVDNGIEQIGWTRVTDSIIEQYGDPSAGPNAAQLEFFFMNGWLSTTPRPATGNYFSVVTIVVSPGSRGYVAINSSDPFDFPLINPNYFSDVFDLAAMKDSITKTQAFLKGPSWDGYIAGPAPPFAGVETDEELTTFAREEMTTIWHPVGTARMQKNSSDTEAVVTSELLVKGAAGLRVVDASVFPYIPASHPQAPIYALAERAADLIKLAWAFDGYVSSPEEENAQSPQVPLA